MPPRKRLTIPSPVKVANKLGGLKSPREKVRFVRRATRLRLSPRTKAMLLRELKKTVKFPSLVNAGYSVSELKALGYTAKRLKEKGYIVKELENAGYSLAELKEAGYSAWDLKRGASRDCSIKVLRELKYSKEEISYAERMYDKMIKTQHIARDPFYDPKMTHRPVDGSLPANKLLKLGYTIRELGYRDRFILLELKELGYSEEKLRDEGFFVEKIKR